MNYKTEIIANCAFSMFYYIKILKLRRINLLYLKYLLLCVFVISTALLFSKFGEIKNNWEPSI